MGPGETAITPSCADRKLIMRRSLSATSESAWSFPCVVDLRNPGWSTFRLSRLAAALRHHPQRCRLVHHEESSVCPAPSSTRDSNDSGVTLPVCSSGCVALLSASRISLSGLPPRGALGAAKLSSYRVAGPARISSARRALCAPPKSAPTALAGRQESAQRARRPVHDSGPRDGPKKFSPAPIAASGAQIPSRATREGRETQGGPSGAAGRG